MLGDQHVKNSPLRISVAEMKMESLGSELLRETDSVILAAKHSPGCC